MIDLSKIKIEKIKDKSHTLTIGTLEVSYKVSSYQDKVPDSDINQVIQTAIFFQVYGEIRAAIRKAWSVSMMGCDPDSRPEIEKAFEELNAMVNIPK